MKSWPSTPVVFFHDFQDFKFICLQAVPTWGKEWVDAPVCREGVAGRRQEHNQFADPGYWTDSSEPGIVVKSSSSSFERSLSCKGHSIAFFILFAKCYQCLNVQASLDHLGDPVFCSRGPTAVPVEEVDGQDSTNMHRALQSC